RTECGDGVVEGREECDDGEDNSDTEVDACRTNCRMAYCGDGVIDTGEVCDDGESNSDTQPDACRPGSCVPAFCGDGVTDTGEECDDGNDEEGDGCTPDCELEEGWACTKSEEHTSEPSHVKISYAVFCFKKKT